MADPTLTRALLARQTSDEFGQSWVQVRYREARGLFSERRVDPFGLVFRVGFWYMVGHCHLRGGLRSFRLDRVQGVDVLAQLFERPTNFSALDYLKTSIAALPRRYALDIVLRTDLATAQREVFSDFGVLQSDTNGVRLRSQVDDIDWAARQLARLPFEVEVRSPGVLRQALRQLGKRLVSLHGRARK